MANGPDILGTSGPDTLTGTTASETMWGFGGNDWFFPLQGDDVIWGNGATPAADDGTMDTVFYGAARSQYTIKANADGSLITVADTVPNREGTDTLHNIERLVFADQHLSFDLKGDPGQAYRLYQAAFNRAPDAAGLGVQINALDTGTPLVQLSQNFIDSAEFAATYGTLNNTQFITQLYANVLHRAPEPAGLAYYQQNMAAGETRAQVLMAFSESPENQANVVGQGVTATGIAWV